MASPVYNSNDQQWRTAIVADSSIGRRSIGRLDAMGIEYQVVADGCGKSRILVPRDRLDEVVELLDDLELPAPVLSRNPGRVQSYRQQLRLLVAIPLGGGIGMLISTLLGIPASSATVLPAICAAMICIFAAASNRPSQAGE